MPAVRRIRSDIQIRIIRSFHSSSNRNEDVAFRRYQFERFISLGEQLRAKGTRMPTQDETLNDDGIWRRERGSTRIIEWLDGVPTSVGERRRSRQHKARAGDDRQMKKAERERGLAVCLLFALLIS